MTTEHLAQILRNLPTSPGVYQMKNAKEEIIYIGKAKNLKNRVRSYFRSDKSHSPKTRKMVEEIVDIHYIETNSDLDAFLLETNLIKQYRPPYNILMRDDKFFVYLKITREDFPRVSIVRRVERDGASYYGPKTSREQVKHTLKLLRKLFPIRDCSLNITEEAPGQVTVTNNTRGKLPCMDFHLAICTGPCDGLVSSTDYKEVAKEIKLFLGGTYQPIIQKLDTEMRTLAQEHKFEQAAKRRDLIHSIEKLMQKQQINGATGLQSRDVIAFTTEGEKFFFNIFQVRDDKIINQENIILEEHAVGGDSSSPEEIITSFLKLYYSASTDIPQEIYTEYPLPLEEENLMTTWLSEQRGSKVTIMHPKRGSKHELLFLAKKNALSFAKQQQIKWINQGNSIHSQGPTALQEALQLPALPHRIECYDISHLGGTNTVGSMVVMEEGKPKNSLYRSFTLRTIASGEIDDFKSMEEVLFRRLRHLVPLPTGYTLTKLKKQELQEQTDLTPSKDLSVYGLYQEEAPEGFFALRSIGEKQAELTLHLGSDLKHNKPLLATVLDLLWKKLPKMHIYCEAVSEEDGFYRTLGFGPAHTLPDGLASNRSWIHRAPSPSKKDPSLSKTPDLIVIDGGKGQLSHTQAAMHRLGLHIPMISLAKREEEVFLPNNSDPIILPQNNPGLLLLRQIRDEAHRFAVSLQSKKHRKRSTESLLDEIQGVGKSTRKKLLSTFGSVHKIKTLTVEELEQLVGTSTAKKIYQYFH